MRVDIKSLLNRLNATTQRALEGASGLCVNRGHYEVAIQHMLLDLLEERQSDIALLLRHYEIDPDNWAKLLHREIESFRDGNPGKPTFAQSLLDWMEDAWLVGSIDVGQSEIRSGTLLLSLSRNAMKFGVSDLPGLNELSEESIRRDFDKVAGASVEASSGAEYRSTSASSGGDASAIEKFTTNFTQRAREGKIDPVFGRDREIRQMIDILGRRRKNNPIAVGEPGVGKTAVVEGLALKVAEGDVPDILTGVEIVGLDLGLLQAGASVKGEFEKRLNSVINAIKASEKPMVLFIDEAHTLIGAGGAAGTGDAANLLKPALARGELRTIAATTWSEYKKYFEKDPALARRFQLVKLDEPSSELAAVILRGIRTIYEDTHDVYVRDEAVAAAAELSARYISGRLLPDKAVDVLDTSCARVKISLTTKPSEIDDLERHIATLERELGALQRDIDSGRSSNAKRQQELETELTDSRAKVATETVRWQEELAAVDRVVELRHKVNEATASKGNDGEPAQATAESADKKEVAESADASEESTDVDVLKRELNAAIAEVEKLQAGNGFIDYEVTKAVVAKVISDWTGVPIGNILKNESESISSFAEKMKSWVKGQDHAVDVIDAGIRTAKAGLNNPDQPAGIFLLVGPSGVGKTETALGVANLMYGGERFMTTINMSEFQEKHTVSKLVGSPAGYVGFGEGGILTEAVRQRPYSVVLLDEVEKADLEVMNLFYQVFDKGTLSDGEGRLIDFRNTVVILTSNLASATIMSMCSGDEMPSPEEITEGIRAELQNHFKPALLGRMTIVPFYPIKGEALHSIVRIKLGKVGGRLKSAQEIEFEYGDDVVEHIAARCTDIESGARNIDHIVNKTLLPLISNEVLQRIGAGTPASKLGLAVTAQGEFQLNVS